VPVSFVTDAWRVMAEAHWHTYQVLTKRPERLARVLARVHMSLGLQEPLPNVWVGTSIELDEHTQRADHLRAEPAAVRFLSLEPLLGPLPSLDLTGIDWVIAGGESGPDYRPLSLDWVRDIRDRCIQLGIPLFFKQVGGLTPQAGGRELDGRTWDEMPPGKLAACPRRRGRPDGPGMTITASTGCLATPPGRITTQGLAEARRHPDGLVVTSRGWTHPDTSGRPAQELRRTSPRKAST